MIPIYLIAPPEQPEHWPPMAAQLAVMPEAAPVIIPALGHRAIPLLASQILADSAFWAPQTAALGQFLSHVNAWQELAKTALPHAAIVEARAHILSLPSLEKVELPADFDIIFLRNLAPGELPPARILQMSAALSRPELSISNLIQDGYLLTPAGAAKLLDALRTDWFFGYLSGRLARYATSESELAKLGDADAATVIRAHHNSQRMPKLGLLQGYVAFSPLARWPNDPGNLGGRAPSTGARRYDYLRLTEPPADFGLLQTYEAPCVSSRRFPEFAVDLSDQQHDLQPPAHFPIHGTDLVRRAQALLFGPNNLVTPEGYWFCESRSRKHEFLDYMKSDFYAVLFPGKWPQVDARGSKILRTSKLSETDVTRIYAPVFLATPLEPTVWGRWIANVIPRAMRYNALKSEAKFLCHVQHPWQARLLQSLGIPPERMFPHDPGRSYICRDVLMLEYSESDLRISAQEKQFFIQLAERHHGAVAPRPLLFVSRLSRSRDNRNYRVLQNEAALATLLEALGFAIIEPELLSFEEQISSFAQAREVVFLGGSAIFNAVFCPPGTSIMLIESSRDYVNTHIDLLSVMGHRHAVIFGQQDPTDPSPRHKRWSLDLPQARRALLAFFGRRAAMI